jgi:hypothetical protein
MLPESLRMLRINLTTDYESDTYDNIANHPNTETLVIE